MMIGAKIKSADAAGIARIMAISMEEFCNDKASFLLFLIAFDNLGRRAMLIAIPIRSLFVGIGSKINWELGYVIS